MIKGYFHCFSGVSGDMLVGAFLDSGVELTELQSELSKLKLTGYRIYSEKVLKNGLGGTKFKVEAAQDHPFRNLNDILNLIEQSGLSKSVKQKSVKTFELLGEIESGIHGCDIGKIHFHEIGAVDSIIDIVSVFICDQLSGIDQYYCSKIHIGTGFTNCDHGLIPLPSPATSALLRGLPTFSLGIPGELATPTGAALLKILVDEFDRYPAMIIKDTGYGAGSRDLKTPNLLRLIIGESSEDMAGNGFQTDQIVLVQANIDDMNPEYYHLVMDKLEQAGTVDVFLEQVIMKNSRPGVILNVLVEEQNLLPVGNVILRETSTFGLRFQKLNRFKLVRKIKEVKTDYGPIKVKLGLIGDDLIKIAPEYRDCRRISIEHNIPLDEVYQLAKSKFNQEHKI
ncbi:MAG: hypothetical protein APR63_10220 [Desulfuromonas sp. SDB]|nr:MAG: hypothetical protein APR63_10220 [Desulfuromonas sp. SDB]